MGTDFGPSPLVSRLLRDKGLSEWKTVIRLSYLTARRAQELGVLYAPLLDNRTRSDAEPQTVRNRWRNS